MRLTGIPDRGPSGVRFLIQSGRRVLSKGGRDPPAGGDVYPWQM